MNQNMNHPYIKLFRDSAFPQPLSFFASLVAKSKPWDFKRSHSFLMGDCPQTCPDTVTLCGQCVDHDVPGNINYGWVGHAAAISEEVLLCNASKWGKDVNDAFKNAFKLGKDLWNEPVKRGFFCMEVLQNIQSEKCKICLLEKEV